MNYAVVTTKVDLQTKKQAMATAQSMGVSLSDVIKALLKQFIRTKTVNFDTRNEVPNAYFKRMIRQAEKDYKAGKASPAFDNVKEEIKWLEEQGI